MTIKTKNWNINVETAQGAEKLEISGTVVVPTPAYEVALVVAPGQEAGDLRLDLVVTHLDHLITLQVETEKVVTFLEPGPMQYNNLSVYYNDKLILTSTNWLMNC